MMLQLCQNMWAWCQRGYINIFHVMLLVNRTIRIKNNISMVFKCSSYYFDLHPSQHHEILYGVRHLAYIDHLRIPNIAQIIVLEVCNIKYLLSNYTALRDLHRVAIMLIVAAPHPARSCLVSLISSTCCRCHRSYMLKFCFQIGTLTMPR